MELRHFRYFVAVAEEENVSRAALKLHVSQPGVSRQIHDLEDEIGFELFQRGAKSLRLTEAGRSFLAEARAVLQRADQAVKAARAVAQGAPGEIHVGYAPSLTVQILPRTLRTFQAEFPRVRVHLHDLSTEEILSRLHGGQLQVGLMVRPGLRMLRGLSFKELARYPIRVAMSPQHRLAKAKTISLTQVASEPLIAYSRSEYPEYHKQLDKMFDGLRRKPRIAEEHDSVTSMIAAVEAGRGLAIVPSCLACMTGPRLKLAALREHAPEIVVGATWKSRSVPPVVLQFIGATTTAARSEP